MAGRENGVTKAFERLMVAHCKSTEIADLSVSLEGRDREYNADDMFAIDGNFFLIEFKSAPYDFSAENEKTSACNLCGCLLESDEGTALHRSAHFACAGRLLKGELRFQIDVYLDLICGEDRLVDCEHVKGRQTKISKMLHGEFFARVKSREFGLPSERFKKYLKWLSQCPGNSGEGRNLDLVLYVFSDALGVIGKHFVSIDELLNWSASAVAQANFKKLSHKK